MQTPSSRHRRAVAEENHRGLSPLASVAGVLRPSEALTIRASDTEMPALAVEIVGDAGAANPKDSRLAGVEEQVIEFLAGAGGMGLDINELDAAIGAGAPVAQPLPPSEIRRLTTTVGRALGGHPSLWQAGPVAVNVRWMLGEGRVKGVGGNGLHLDVLDRAEQDHLLSAIEAWGIRNHAWLHGITLLTARIWLHKRPAFSRRIEPAAQLPRHAA